jgi:hypothetical protein
MIVLKIYVVRKIGWSKMQMNASMGSQWEAKKIAFLVGRRIYINMVFMEGTEISLRCLGFGK